jgi:uncharacterized protein YjbI with pentapeptide repeats
MADETQVEILRNGYEVWNDWRDHNPGVRPDLSCTILDDADLHGANLKNADLTHAILHRANLCEADLSHAELVGTNFCEAKLRDACLRRADLHRANLHSADLTRADLTGADLERAVLVQTTVEGARFSGAKVYGVSAWDLIGIPADSTQLVVTQADQPTVTVSDLEVAQFIYLLINNAKIRRVIDTVTAKAVLILGRFTEERKEILYAIRDGLSAEGYVPIIFDFDKPATRKLTETMSTLAHLARFVVADITDPKSIPQELMMIIPQLPSVPVQPIVLAGKEEWALFADLRWTGRILEVFRYDNIEDVRRNLKERILDPAANWLNQFSGVRNPMQEIATLREQIRKLKAAGTDERSETQSGDDSKT